MTTEKTKPVCKECKSDSVVATDATVEWDIKNQRWEWHNAGQTRDSWMCSSDKCQGDWISGVEWVKA